MKQPKHEQLLGRALRAVLRAEEQKQGHKLDAEERKTFLYGWPKTLLLAANRMVTGSREHSDSKWSTVNFSRERSSEMIDAMHYDFGEELYNRQSITPKV